MPTVPGQSGFFFGWGGARSGGGAGLARSSAATPASTDSSSAFYNVPKSYWIATSDLGEWIVPKGYAWHP